MQGTADEITIGRFYGSREIDITPDLVSTYVKGTGDSNPWYTTESPFGGPVAPALLLHSEVYRDVSWYLSVFGNLHARQEWEMYHPIMVGERVSASRVIVDRYVKRDREYVVNEVSVTDAGGRLLNRGRTHQSFLLRQGNGGGDVVDKDREKRPDRTFELGGGEVIEELSGPLKHVTVEMCQHFSGPAKNYHNDVEAARSLGFPDIVVQGMMSLCFLSEMMTERFGPGWYSGGRMNVNLVNVLWGGEKARARGVVKEMVPAGPQRRAVLQVWCEKEDGTKIVVGSASALQAQA